MRRVLANTVHVAEVARWRLSKALGVPGLERISWACIVFTGIALGFAVSSVLSAIGIWRASAAPPLAQHAYINFVVQLVIMVVAAIIAYATRPKPETPKANTPSVPVAEDGKGIVEIFGTVWVDDANQLAWKAKEPIAIRRKGGKK